MNEPALVPRRLFLWAWPRSPAPITRSPTPITMVALGAALALFTGASCKESVATPASAAAATTGTPESTGQKITGASPLMFRYADASGGPALTSDGLHGRPTVLALLATYDVASQAEARILNAIQRSHRPRIHVAAIVLEPVENLPLVAAFRDAIGLDYPVALADEPTMTGKGPFGDLRAVPSVLILDEEGRPIWRHIGLARANEIEAALDAVDKP